MIEDNLSVAFSDSLEVDIVEGVSELAEIGLDSIMDEGVLKEVPFLSTVISLYKVGTSIKERHNLKKLAAFLDGVNKGITSEDKRKEYQQKFRTKDKFRNQEMEYLLVLIDRYINYEKPKMLAKLYLAYLDAVIVWEEMTMYSEVIDRMLLLDYNTLVSDSDEFIVHRNIGGEAILRLVALGLMADITNASPFEEEDNGSIGMTWDSLISYQTNDRTYRRTEFGEKLANILRETTCET